MAAVRIILSLGAGFNAVALFSQDTSPAIIGRGYVRPTPALLLDSFENWVPALCIQR
jgi:hypothetical protein